MSRSTIDVKHAGVRRGIDGNGFNVHGELNRGGWINDIGRAVGERDPDGGISGNSGVHEQRVERSGLEDVERDGALSGRGRADDCDVLQVSPTNCIGHVVGVEAV